MAQEQYQKIGLMQSMIGTILYNQDATLAANQELIQAAKQARIALRRLEKALRRHQKEQA